MNEKIQNADSNIENTSIKHRPQNEKKLEEKTKKVISNIIFKFVFVTIYLFVFNFVETYRIRETLFRYAFL